MAESNNTTTAIKSDNGKSSKSGSKDTGIKTSKKTTLSANAVPFDVSASPTINPYGGQYGIQTQPAYVPPAPIPPTASSKRKSSNRQRRTSFVFFIFANLRNIKLIILIFYFLLYFVLYFV